ncbi:hypothetical protein LP421_13115 [Rhizobium sp. RCAM05350]|nr:hypothetical protein LP421_13115 [Rhizobium sp. RCAM05350]
MPELSASAFGDATVRQVLDMTTGLRYSEDYADPGADVGPILPPEIPCRNRPTTKGRRAISSICRPLPNRANTALPSATRRSTPMRWAGSLRASAAVGRRSPVGAHLEPDGRRAGCLLHRRDRHALCRRWIERGLARRGPDRPASA